MAASPFFDVSASDQGDRIALAVTAAGGSPRRYRIAGPDPDGFADFFDRLHADFGTRRLHSEAAHPVPSPVAWRPLLTDNAHPRILAGYGDPAVLRTAEGWWLTATSNDAPDAFPLLHSDDLAHWTPRGFVFAEGYAPAWTAAGRHNGDFWAPEMARVGDEYWLVYTARDRERVLSIGLARAPHPGGPWRDNGAPLLGGAAIDGHLHVDEDGAPWLLWKEDTNSRWPRALAGLMRAFPALIDRLFDEEGDRRTAAFAAAIHPFAETRRPMERYFLLQPLIRAVLARWVPVRAALAECGQDAAAILEWMRTPIVAQRLRADGRAFEGERHRLLENDQPWEGHLVEGPFLTRQQGRHFLFYAANDYTSADYGIGVAVADRLTGPYRKVDGPLLRSSPEWSAPGHASVAPGPDGELRLFFHAYRPGTGGYNVFRALLTVGLAFDGGRVELRP